MVLGIGIKHVGGDSVLDHVLQDFGAKLFIIDQFGVLGGDYDGVDSDRLFVLVVFDRDLGFAIRPQEVELTSLANLGQPLREPVGEQDWGRH